MLLGRERCKLTNKVSVLEVEPVQLIAGLFGIGNVLVNDECCSLGCVCNPLSNLAAKTDVSNVIPNSRRRCSAGAYRIGPNLPKRSKSSSAVTL